MFDGIARRYDLLNRLLSLGVDRRWRARAVRLLGDRPGRVLDVACGTGDLSLSLSRRGALVTGVDLSENMLRVARAKSIARRLPVTFLQGDAERLDFPPDSFDAVTVAFGVRNFEHPDACLAEFYRVLRPGGRLVILEFSTPTRFPVAPLYRLYFARLLPLIGGLASGDRPAYAYLPATVYAFPPPPRFLSIIRSAGFDDPAVASLSLGIAALYSARKPRG
jgi:demethylmenaquinone methyltransferase/2-methoxy-6-polyprenyl-1,4-benzoquinol methylase